ncbi:MAG: hypothetical protein PHE25_06125, partial [Candidatus Gracilibacteria bacterium]|nr:hypothetical protein [Candidatus Gracilibacteria bacterium]
MTIMEYFLLITLINEYSYLYSVLERNYQLKKFMVLPQYYFNEILRLIFSIIAFIFTCLTLYLIYYGYNQYGFVEMLKYQIFSILFLGIFFNVILNKILLGKLFYDILFTILPIIVLGYGVYIYY